MQTQMVPAQSLHHNPNDMRDRTTAAYRAWVIELAADIKERGIRNPIIVIPDGTGFTILAGMTRWEAAKLAGLTEVPVNVLDRPLKPGEMLREQLLENEMRRDFTDVERAEMYAALMKENDWTQADLARELRISPARVSKVMVVSSKLPADLQAMIGHGDDRIPPTSAYLLSRLPTQEAMRELADRIVAGSLTRDYLEREVNKRLGKRQPKGKPVKVKLPGLTLVISVDELTQFFGLLTRMLEAAKKAEKLNLPITCLPQLLR